MHHLDSDNRKILGLVAIAVLAPTTGFAHTGTHEVSSIAAGLLHPFTGLDHLLAMLAVGLWAAQISGRQAWLLPALFPLAMVADAALALGGIGFPLVEPMIAISVIILGALVLAGASPPLAMSAPLISVFALAHGHAHGSELPAGGDMAGYATGFIGATVILHLTGLFLGLLSQRWRHGMLTRISGSAVAVSGFALLWS